MSDEFEGLDATEKAGIERALNRCRALAAKIPGLYRPSPRTMRGAIVWYFLDANGLCRPLRSFAPERFAKKVIGVAWAAGAGRISAAANASKQEPIELRGSDSFMFASLAQDKELWLRMNAPSFPACRHR